MPIFWFCLLAVSALPGGRRRRRSRLRGEEEASLVNRYPSYCPTGSCRRGGRAWSLSNVIKEEEEKKEEVEGKSKDEE